MTFDLKRGGLGKLSVGKAYKSNLFITGKSFVYLFDGLLFIFVTGVGGKNQSAESALVAVDEYILHTVDNHYFFFEFFGIDILAVVENDNVFASARYEKIAFLVEVSEVARIKPSVF